MDVVIGLVDRDTHEYYPDRSTAIRSRSKIYTTVLPRRSTLREYAFDRSRSAGRIKRTDNNRDNNNVTLFAVEQWQSSVVT
jgi:hypothetical protein